MTNSPITDLLDQLDRLAEHTRMAVQRLTVALVDDAQEAQRRREASRNATVIDRMHRVADYVSQMRFADVYTFESGGSVHLGHSGNAAMGLIEWFYLLPGPKKVVAYTYDDKVFVRVVSDAHSAREISVVSAFESAEAHAIVQSCQKPSVHVLRRLQIAGAR